MMDLKLKKPDLLRQAASITGRWITGRWIDANEVGIQVINPTTGDVLEDLP